MLLPKLYLLRTQAPPEVVLERVAALLAPPPAGPGPGEGRADRALCAGWVEGARFELRRRSRDGGAGPIRIRGEVTPDGAGAKVLLRFRITGGALAGLVLLGALLGGALAVILRHRGTPASAPELLAAGAAGLGAVAFTFRLGWEKARLLRLVGYLSGELDGAWLDLARAGAGR